MPITLDNSNIRVTYNTGSNYIIETVKSDLYVKDTVGTTSNLSIEPSVSPNVIVADAYYPRVPATNSLTWTDNGKTIVCKVSDAVLGESYVYFLFNHIITSQDHYHSQQSYTVTGNKYAGATRFKTFAGIAISIDFGRSIYPKRMRIAPRPLQSGWTGNDFILGAPKEFKIFASDDASCWNNNNHSSWTQIHDQTTSLSYVNEQYTIVDFTSNLSKYRYYTMVVLSTIGNYAGGYMMFSEWNVGGDEKIDAIPEGTLNKILSFSYSVTKNVEYLAQQKTGVGGWRIVRYLPPTSTTNWYQGNYINNSTFNIPTIGTPYNYTTEWAVPFGTFDEMFFGTLGMTYWLRCLKTSVLGTYNNAARPIISSSFSSTPYSANWYNRSSYTEDPWISIQNFPTQVVYGENLTNAYLNLVPLDGGMCVLVRNSSTSTLVNPYDIYTLTFPVRTLVDVNNNSNLILQGDYNVNVGHPTSSLLPAITNTSNTLIPLPNTTTSNVSVRYHLLNPVKTTEGAQWTYSSNNPNVYHLGNVGIGTTNPEYNLDVRGNIYTSVGGYTQSGTENWIIQSDRRIKENIVKASYEKCLENVKKIELYNFNFKDNYVNTNDRNQLGFIAQEVQEVYPKAVIVKPDEKIEELLTVNTTQIKYTLYGAVRSLIEKVERIEERVDKLYKLAIPDVEIKEITSKITEIFESTSNIILPAPNIP